MAKEFLAVWFIDRKSRYTSAADRRQPAYQGKEVSLDFSRYCFPIHRLALVVTLVLSSLILQSALFSSITQGQVTTAITSDGTLNTQVGQSGNVFDITGGTRPGNGPNLFHSFGQFSVGEGDVANFLNNTAAPTANILSRVSGGNPSSIFGTVQTQGFGNANLFLMNPAGIIFGLNASLNVGGAAHFTTADYLKLAAGVQFTALPGSQDAVLSIAPVTAFGFLESNVSPIVMEGSTLSVADGEVISLVGGDISIGGGLNAPGGQIGLASVTSSGEIFADTFEFGPNANGEVFVGLGSISLSQGASIDTTGNKGGNVIIRGGRLMVDGSSISANAQGSSGGPVPALLEQGVNVQLTGDLLLDNGSVIATNVFSDVATGVGSGGVRIQANRVEIRRQSFVESIVREGSEGGRSGDIEVNAISMFIQTEDLEINGALQTGTFSSADGGNIDVKLTENLEAREGSFIWTFTEGSGNAGDIGIVADKVILSSSIGNILTQFTGITSQPDPFEPSQFTTGDVGDISLTANYLELNNAQISTSTFTSGNAGDITIIVNGNALISGSPDEFFGIFSNTFADGQGGSLLVAANNLSLTNVASLQAATFFDVGDAGDLTLNLTGNLEIEDGSFIQTLSGEFATGDAGNLSIKAQDITIAGIKDATNFEISPEFTGISAATFEGQGGNLTIDAKNLVVRDKGFINTGTRGSGKSGDLAINLSSNLLVANGGQIFAEARSSGNAGSINIQGDSIVLSGVNETLSIRRDESILRPHRSAITSRSQDGSGTSGNINVGARELSILDGAVVAASNSGPANAGNIQLTATDTILLDGATVSTEAVQASGGNINLQAQELIRLNDTTISSSVQGSATTVGGNISLDPEFIILQNSQILAKAVEGQGGNISLVATNAVLADPLSVLDASSALGVSGSVDIQAPIQNLSGTIAPLPEETTPVNALYGARCAAGQGGHFSTFVDSKTDSLSPSPGRFLASPLLSPLVAQANTVATSVGPQRHVILTASIAPLVLGYAGQPPTSCP